MRLFLLAALMAALVMPQPVEAARRDDRPQVSRSAPASTVGRTNTPAASRAAAKPEPAKAGARQAAQRPPAARQTAPRQASSRQASNRQASNRQAAARPTASRQAALRPGDVRTQRQGVVVRGAAAATLPRGPAAAARTATRSDASCTRRNGRTICSAPVERPLSWQAGLPSASNAQRDCPAGTLATLARGHNDIVRCMPL